MNISNSRCKDVFLPRNQSNRRPEVEVAPRASHQNQTEVPSEITSTLAPDGMIPSVYLTSS